VRRCQYVSNLANLENDKAETFEISEDDEANALKELAGIVEEQLAGIEQRANIMPRNCISGKAG